MRKYLFCNDGDGCWGDRVSKSQSAGVYALL